MKTEHDEIAARQRPNNKTKKWFINGMKLLQSQKLHPKKIGDFGAGKGEALELLQETFPSAECWGFDYANTNLQTLKDKKIHNKYINFDEINKLTFTELAEHQGTFDLIVSFATIEHIFDTDAFFELANFLLKENGRLLISTPNLDAYQMKFFYFVKGYPYDEGHHIRFFTFRRLNAYAFLNGFTPNDEASYFYYGISPIQKSLRCLSRNIAAAISILLFCPAFLSEKIGLWPKATKGDLLVLFQKTKLTSIGYSQMNFTKKWSKLSSQEKNDWKNIIKQPDGAYLRKNKDTFRLMKHVQNMD